MYKVNQYGVIIRISDGAIIPPDENNTDYVEYLAWLAQGNTPVNYVEGAVNG